MVSQFIIQFMWIILTFQKDKQTNGYIFSTFSTFSLTSLTGSSTSATSAGIALALIAVYFPLVVMVILEKKRCHQKFNQHQYIFSDTDSWMVSALIVLLDFDIEQTLDGQPNGRLDGQPNGWSAHSSCYLSLIQNGQLDGQPNRWPNGQRTHLAT